MKRTLQPHGMFSVYIHMTRHDAFVGEQGRVLGVDIAE